jgi:hypothetical protein
VALSLLPLFSLSPDAPRFTHDNAAALYGLA